MKRIFLTLLCLGMLGTAGCYYDPANPPTVDFSVGVGAYVVDEPDYWYYYPRRDNWYDDWRYRERWRHRHDRYDRWR
jgi:hypothetical protein